MAFKKFRELPVSVRRSREKLYEYLVSGIEGKVDNDTIYDDTNLTARVSALETILGDSDDDTVYDDALLTSRIEYLEGLLSYNIGFTVKDGNDDPVEGAVVNVTASKTGTTGSAGGCTIHSVLQGEYNIRVVAEGYEDYTDTIQVDESNTMFNVVLTPANGEE